jgi:hypothetical protein
MACKTRRGVYAITIKRKLAQKNNARTLEEEEKTYVSGGKTRSATCDRNERKMTWTCANRGFPIDGMKYGVNAIATSS